MEQFWREVLAGLPALSDVLHVGFRLLVAAIVGAVPGIQREHVGMAAGLRTHILVSLGAAMFVVVSLDMDATPDATTRVLQGIVTGIGFVGAGAILKSNDERHIVGLTSASSIWMTAGLGSAAGAGRLWPAFCGAILAFIVLSVLRRFESHVRPHEPAQSQSS